MKRNLYLGGQNMLSINQLIKYLRNHHHITVKSNQAQSLRNIGYYHGYKGYRFIRTPNQRIPFSSLDEGIDFEIDKDNGSIKIVEKKELGQLNVARAQN